MTLISAGILFFAGCSSVSINERARSPYVSVQHRSNIDLTVIAGCDKWPSKNESSPDFLEIAKIAEDEKKIFKIKFLNKVVKNASGNKGEALVVQIKDSRVIAYLDGE